jgi:hypothetical protein
LGGGGVAPDELTNAAIYNVIAAKADGAYAMRSRYEGLARYVREITKNNYYF